MMGQQLLNLGCGKNYHKDWVNIDFTSAGNGVIEQNLLDGVPYDDNSFDGVYHSHVLEHFPKDKAQYFIDECFRVLKPGGTLRVAVPDLEQIAKLYLEKLTLADAGDKAAKADYEWILLEMFDQTVRNYPGGAMADYLFRDEMPNEAFVYGRIGVFGQKMREKWKSKPPSEKAKPRRHMKKPYLFKVLKKLIKSKGTSIGSVPEQIGNFRLSGEIHQWMYDRYSLRCLLETSGFASVLRCDAFHSRIPDFARYQLDVLDGRIIKADSLFMEAVK